MKAALITRLDGPSAVDVRQIEPETLAPGHVRVSVKAVALNFMDTLMTRGRYQVRPELPFSPGAEIAGVVTECATDVTRLEPGDAVAGYIGYGGARDIVCAPADRLAIMPDTVSFEAASGVAVTYGTAIYGLSQRANVQPGASLAVLGASGGAGLAAVEIGNRLGARVIAVASTEEKLQMARDHGAADGINYTATDLKSALRDATGGAGPQCVYDCVGGDHAQSALRALAPGGSYIVIGFAAGDIPAFPGNIILLKDCNLLGIHWGAAVEADPQTHRAHLERLLGWVADGSLSPVVSDVRPLSEITTALNDIAERRAVGKIVLKP